MPTCKMELFWTVWKNWATCLPMTSNTPLIGPVAYQLKHRYQATWVGHITHGATLSKYVLERRIQGKKHSERPQCRTLDWTMNRDNGYTYQNLKQMAQCQRAWRDWCQRPALGQRTLTRQLSAGIKPRLPRWQFIHHHNNQAAAAESENSYKSWTALIQCNQQKETKKNWKINRKKKRDGESQKRR